MKKLIYTLLIAMVAFASCTDVIDLDLEEQDLDLLVVDAQITTKSNVYAYLTKSVPVTSETANPGASNALITITDDAQPANSITLEESETIPGFYTVPDGESYVGQAGYTYTLQVIYETDTITATEYLQEVSDVDSIIIKPSERGERMFLGIFLFSQEPAGIKNYYKWDFYVNDTCKDELQYLAFSDDALYDGNYVDSIELFTDYHDPMNEDERVLGYMDTVYIKQLSISKIEYEYYFALMNQMSAGSPFSVPPANTPTNLVSTGTKDVRGIFTANDVSVSNVVIIDDSIENKLAEPKHGF